MCIDFKSLKKESSMTKDEYLEYVKDKELASEPNFLVFDSQKIDKEDFMRLIEKHYPEHRFGNAPQVMISLSHFYPK